METTDYKNISLEEAIALLNAKDKEFVKKDQQIVKSESKAVALSSQISLMNQNPDIATRRQEMQYELDMAKQFSASGAFKNMSPEQCYVVMKAGSEMGLKPMESMQALSVINGSVDFYGDKMIARITGKGYKIEYENEVTVVGKEEVTAKVTSPDGIIIRETARATDQIILKSQAAKFALKNKLRFHAVRMIASFHLPHLFSAVTDIFTKDFHEYEEVKQDGKSNAVVPVQNQVPNSEEISFIQGNIVATTDADEGEQQTETSKSNVEVKEDWME